MQAVIREIEFYLPNKVLDNDELTVLYDNWTAEKILEKTGIRRRHVADDNETALDMGYKAAEKLFKNGNLEKGEVDFLIFVTQLPDYRLPANACILQEMLGLSKQTGAIDLNLGCSGYIYGLSVAKAMIVSGMARNVLLITADSISRYVNMLDKSLKTLMGDGASATWISESSERGIEKFIFGTDGSGKDVLIIPSGGERIRKSDETKIEKVDHNGNKRTVENLYMDGAAVFEFSLRVVPATIKNLLVKNNLEMEEIGLFIFHQANLYMLDILKQISQIPEEKFYVYLEDVGNTTSSSIPIAITTAMQQKKLHKGMKVMLVGFGVGLSWAGVVVNF